MIGAGGLGCPCLLTLAGCGAGTIGITDFDKVSVSNLHRQKLLTRHNPYIFINEHYAVVNESNMFELMMPYDVVVDCTYNCAARYVINDVCIYLGKPLEYGAIYRSCK